MIVHDSWWTATAKRADIVLPATTPVERDDIGGSSRDNYVFAMQRAIDPVGSSRNDFSIFSELAERGGHAAAYTEGRTEGEWLQELWRDLRDDCEKQRVALPDYAAFRQQGWVALPAPSRDYVLFEDFRAEPQMHPLGTPSGKIEIFSQTIAAFGYDDCPPHPAWLAPAEWLGSVVAQRFPLHLITIQPPDRLHSQMDSGPLSQANKIAGREMLRLHPADAAARDVVDGDVVRIHNQRGACLAGLRVDAGLMRGVAVIATGAWFDPDGAGPERSGNPNVLSLDIGTSRLAQGPSALSILVDVEKWHGAALPVRVYDQLRSSQ